MGELVLSKSKVVKINVIIVIVFFYMYTLLHEGGHAIVALCCGRTITDFTLGFNAHVSSIGPNYTAFTASLMNVFGMFLPYIVVLFSVLFYSQKIKSVAYHIASFIMVLGISGSLLSWVILPFVYKFGSAPNSDDVVKFIENSGFNFAFVSVSASVLIAILLFVAFRLKRVHVRYMHISKESNVGFYKIVKFFSR